MEGLETRAEARPTLAQAAQMVAQERRRVTQARTGRVKGLKLGALMTAGRTAQAISLAELAAPTAKVRSFRMLDVETQMASPAAKAAMERAKGRD
jgi:hypothetical protein